LPRPPASRPACVPPPHPPAGADRGLVLPPPRARVPPPRAPAAA